MRISSRLGGQRAVPWLVPMIDILRKDACGHIGLFRCLLDHLLAYFPYTDKMPSTLHAAACLALLFWRHVRQLDRGAILPVGPSRCRPR